MWNSMANGGLSLRAAGNINGARIMNTLPVMLLALFVQAAPILAATGLILAAKDKKPCPIVIAADASVSERYAAQELQRYLERITTIKCPIIEDSVPQASREILLGDNAHLRKLGLGIDMNKLGPEGFVLRTVKNKLIIAGGRPRGSLYGVYTLLEEKLGVRWFAPELEVVPRTNRVVLGALDQTRVPRLEYREVFWTEMMRDADFAARHRLNGEHYHLTEKHGGRAVVYFPFVHSLDNLIPRELYQEHPEYFPLIKGKRVNGYVQRCLSNSRSSQAGHYRSEKMDPGSSGSHHHQRLAKRHRQLVPMRCLQSIG
jgi:hypothetical protein